MKQAYFVYNFKRIQLEKNKTWTTSHASAVTCIANSNIFTDKEIEEICSLTFEEFVDCLSPLHAIPEAILNLHDLVTGEVRAHVFMSEEELDEFLDYCINNKIKTNVSIIEDYRKIFGNLFGEFE